MKNKDRDYAYLIGSKYQNDLTWGFNIKEFLNMCAERKQLLAAYKTLMRIKADHIYYSCHRNNPFNDEYTKVMGYLYRRNLDTDTAMNGKTIGISRYEYCLAYIDENFLNHKIYTVSEELAFLNANIKKLKPFFREWKKSHNVKKVNMSTNTDIQFNGIIDVNTEVVLENLSKEQVDTIKKFIVALDKASCSWISSCKLTDKKTGLEWKYK